MRSIRSQSCSGSRRVSASRSSALLYCRSSSDIECEYGRTTEAFTRAGPERARACATASRMASTLAAASVPSTRMTFRLGNDSTSRDTSPPGVWTSTGTEMAYPLSSTTYTTGSRREHAVFNDSQNSPPLVEPSPSDTYDTSSAWDAPPASGCRWKNSPASAPPTACRHCVVVALEGDTMCRAGELQWFGICRPPEVTSAAEPTAASSMSYGVTPSARHSARSR